MNALHPLAVYAAVKAHKGEKLDFPGDIGAWTGVSEHSTAMLTGYLSEWAVLEEKVSTVTLFVRDRLNTPTHSDAHY